MTSSEASVNASASSQVYALDRDSLAEALGTGAYGAVRWVRIDNEVVPVKVWDLDRDIKDQSKQPIQLPEVIRAERKARARIGVHPNILELREFFFRGGFACFFLEPCTGSLVQAWNEEPHLDEHTYARYFGEMAQALKYIHSLGVVHRDVKQDNFMMGGPDGRTVKLGSFGLSAQLNGGRGLEGQFGTTPFMAPEVLSTWARHGFPADMWSFGVIVYTVFFGCFPYWPETKTTRAMKTAILFGTVPPDFAPARHLPQNAVSEEGIRFVRALLDRSPSARPSAAACLEMNYLKHWRYNQLQATATGAQSISLVPMLSSAMNCGAFDVKLTATDVNKITTEMILLAGAQERQKCLPVSRMQTNTSAAATSESSWASSMPSRSQPHGKYDSDSIVLTDEQKDHSLTQNIGP